MSLELAFASATELARRLRRREIGCLEALEATLSRVDRHNPTLNAVVVDDRNRARARAHAADAALRKGEVWGPLHGVPMTVKECIDVAGLRTTAGELSLAKNMASADSAAVERLLQAGAVIFGKTNLPRMTADWHSANGIYGVTNNPWDFARSPGGSSGGAAAALAAGLTFLEIGSDIGGSIRVPSHFCGVFGHKPSFGIVATRGHVPPLPGTRFPADMNVVGPLARSVEDLELALDVLAGPDAAESAAWHLDLPAPKHRSLAEYNVAAWLDDPNMPVDRAVRDRLRVVVDALRQAGTSVDEMARPDFDAQEAFGVYSRLLLGMLAISENSERVGEMRRAALDPASTADPFEQAFNQGAAMTLRDWFADDDQRRSIRDAWRSFFKLYDLVIAPVMPVTAMLHNHEQPYFGRTITVDHREWPYLGMLFWPGLFTMAYLPSTVIPAGRAASGLPVGVQIVGDYLQDRSTLYAASRLSSLIGGFEAPPAFR